MKRSSHINVDPNDKDALGRVAVTQTYYPTSSMNRTQVSLDRWKEAQAAELQYWSEQGADGDDCNDWWFEKFEQFKTVPWSDACHFLLEVGCGPFARNIRKIVETYIHPDKPFIGLNDPLVYHYAAAGKAVRELIDNGAQVSGMPLEFLQMDQRSWDAVICINVLDHVRNVQSCFIAMEKHLRRGGYLILGQDLTNEEDCRQAPDNLTDVKHPILMDEETINTFLSPYESVFERLLPREEGRNPNAHYSTLLFIGRKK